MSALPTLPAAHESHSKLPSFIRSQTCRCQLDNCGRDGSEWSNYLQKLSRTLAVTSALPEPRPQDIMCRQDSDCIRQSKTEQTRTKDARARRKAVTPKIVIRPSWSLVFALWSLVFAPRILFAPAVFLWDSPHPPLAYRVSCLAPAVALGLCL